MPSPSISLKTLNELGYEESDEWEASFHKGIHIRRVHTNNQDKARYEFLIQLDKGRGKELGWIKMYTANGTATNHIDVTLLKGVAYAVLKRFKTSQSSDNLQRLSQITTNRSSLKVRIQKKPNGEVDITTNDPAEHKFERRTNARIKKKLEKNIGNVQSDTIETYKNEKLQKVRNRIFDNNVAFLQQKEEIDTKENTSDTQRLLPVDLAKEDLIHTSLSRFGKIHFRHLQDSFRTVGRYLQDGVTVFKDLMKSRINLAPIGIKGSGTTRSASIFSYKAIIYNSINTNGRKTLLHTIWAGALAGYKIPLGIAKMLTTTTLSRDWNKMQIAYYNLNTNKLDKAKAIARFAFRSMPFSFITRQLTKGLVINPIEIIKNAHKKIKKQEKAASIIAKASLEVAGALIMTPINIVKPISTNITRVIFTPFLGFVTKNLSNLDQHKSKFAMRLLALIDAHPTQAQYEKANNAKKEQKEAKNNMEAAKRTYFASKNLSSTITEKELYYR